MQITTSVRVNLSDYEGAAPTGRDITVADGRHWLAVTLNDGAVMMTLDADGASALAAVLLEWLDQADALDVPLPFD